MLRLILLLSFIPSIVFLQAQQAQHYKFIDATSLSVSGRTASVSADKFHRIDSSFYSKLPPRVAELSKNSAGIFIGFRTNSKNITLKWILGKYNHLWNMTPLAVNGLDLYGWNQGKWQYVASARPQADSNQAALISDLDGAMRHYRLYLPLYAELKKLEIGIDSTATIQKPVAAFIPAKKIVIYGSSITQGASASRPGMAYPSVLSRELNVETYNLGFSGSGKMELILADVLASIEADVYILDCVPNPSPDEIKERAVPFIKRLRQLKPGIPIIMVESIIREQSFWSQRSNKRMMEQNHQFRKAFDQLTAEKYKSLHYISADGLTGHDHEATIDGTHLTDLGFTRLAAIISKTLKKVL